jgi:hypothetical protein
MHVHISPSHQCSIVACGVQKDENPVWKGIERCYVDLLVQMRLGGRLCWSWFFFSVLEGEEAGGGKLIITIIRRVIGERGWAYLITLSTVAVMYAGHVDN